MTKQRPRRSTPLWALAASFAAGCGGGGWGSADLAPPDVRSSTAALVTSLDAWKGDRRASGVLIGSKPSVGVVDSLRTERPLLGYEIVGPLMVVEKARPFAVRLDLDSPRETVETRYLILGRDPLWVFRQEDFERMLHWEHKMDAEAGTGPAGPAPVGP